MAETTLRRLASVIHERPAPVGRETSKRPTVKARASVYLIESSVERFKVSKCMLHWDGKRIKVKRGEVSERCVVYISAADGRDFKKLLGAHEVADGSAASEALVVTDLLRKWGIQEEVKGVVFDTTSSNSGWKSGTCMRVEQSLEKPVLWLVWANEHHASGTWPRDDYKEMLHLSIMYLGGHITNFNFRYPGPDHYARWMSKAIYYLKLALLSEHFHTKEKELEDVKVIAEFVALFYAPSFLQSQLGSASPFNDLKLIRNMMIATLNDSQR